MLQVTLCRRIQAAWVGTPSENPLIPPYFEIVYFEKVELLYHKRPIVLTDRCEYGKIHHSQNL